jgi:hypothetical protein
MRKLGLVSVVLMSLLGTGCASYMANFDGWWTISPRDMPRLKAERGERRFTDHTDDPFMQRNQEIAKKAMDDVNREKAWKKSHPDPILVIILDEN